MTFNKWLTLCLFIIGTSACAGSFTTVKVKVVDQDGLPVENAEVFTGFILGNKGANVKTLSDKNGNIRTTKRQDLGVMIRINKEGYYQSETRTGPSDQNLTMELRQKKQPTAMYAKHITLRFPKKQTELGFDFEQADWVAPYGKGNTAHIFFYLDGEYIDVFNNNNELRVSFAHAEDGLIKLKKATTHSEYSFPYQAPLAAYNNNLILKKSRSPNANTISTYDSSTLGYIFRVNTKLNSEGEVIQANYGKIMGEFIGSAFVNTTKGPNKGFVKFTYYYNPTPNDRSLEFDWRQNLFPNLEQEEKVKAP